MARILIQDMDWIAIQQMYDAGSAIRAVCSQFSISPKTINKARGLGLFSSRTESESKKLEHARFPRDYSASRLDRAALTNYRADCSFKFNLADYPTRFDFSLVETYGWYSAKNRGNNAVGVSRDHIVSVRYGFDNNIHPDIIAHPANCRLIQQSENASKSLKCNMTLGELFARIEIFSYHRNNSSKETLGD